jgi:hypothetical protein
LYQLKGFHQFHLSAFGTGRREGQGESEIKNGYRACLLVYNNYYRKKIETVFSEITELFPKHIHAVTIEGFIIKVSFFIYAFALQKAFL